MSDVEIEPEIPEEDTRKRRSFSQLSSYINCSEAYRLERVVRPRPPKRPAPWFTLGLAIHKALENWEATHRTSDMEADFIEEYNRVRALQLEEQPDLSLWINPWRGKTVHQALDMNFEKGLEQIRAYKEWHNDPNNVLNPMIDPEDGSVWVEVPFDIELGRVPVVGFIDLVDENGLPLDLKSGAAKNSKPLQLGLYRTALKKQYGIDGSTGQFFYTKVDGRSRHGLSEQYDTTRYTEEYLTDLFEAMEKGIENEIYLPNPGDGCGICPVMEWCREKGSSPIPLRWNEIPEGERWWGQRTVDESQ